jgi:arylsulfatase A-like enzyme
MDHLPRTFPRQQLDRFGRGQDISSEAPGRLGRQSIVGQPYTSTVFDFAYFKKNPNYAGPCPGAGAPASAGPSEIDTWCALDEPDENFYDHGLASNVIEQLRYAAALDKPFFVAAGFARPHAPWRVPKRFWDLYRTEDIPLAKHPLPPQNMPGVAWQQNGFYNASNGFVFEPEITVPLDEWVAKNMRHAYYASVSFLDYELGRVFDELQRLDIVNETAVVLHGDHGWQLGEHNS